MNTKEMIGVMQAYFDGKSVEFKVSGSDKDKWVSTANPVWNWSTYDYRVKKEPNEVWMVYGHYATKSLLNVFNDEASARSYLSSCAGPVSLEHYKQVMDS